MNHGGDLTEAMARYGGEAADWLDLSTGINPWAYPFGDIADAAWRRLPSQADGQALLAAARHAYRVPDGVDLVAAPGTQALIQWLPHLAANGPVAIVGPTYNEHAPAWQNAGHEVIAISDLAALPDEAVHVVIVNPNNPDGRIADHATLAAVAAKLHQRGGWLLVDEAFADVDPAIGAAVLCEKLPVVILRSFGKFYGLGGLRLGFAIAAPETIKRIAAVLGAWAVSGPALQVGARALGDDAWGEHMRAQLIEHATRLDFILTQAGGKVIGGTSLFRFVRHPDARYLHVQLARQRVWVRKFDWASDHLRFGLPANDAALGRLADALSTHD
ncbi:threonine-phosphate decarboxylase [Tardiphaga sp. vice352]|uniref:threonine-phosphate decarboxylase CobD n=1 Tax=unclassified Tardiphaga TaxID=2631404 RepID=UPI0011644DF1|nr:MULTISPECIES: threonine-phosphate decarboxylase CobD [unclassified Tardiphaga]QDM18145.1 threonine-phosphate decarboxylase [Tardiphaga sp. vice278]QDM23181.1 threonine-phosphate decarboxylase [Tardiphaga sp. vice154]QDM28357.1 threonine-phosphate decarboxylase [Tardiphaga sp. vice304]QDM33491.1 threonine-phosphate decarboxylase [Tardiphaga sp. vice352]